MSVAENQAVFLSYASQDAEAARRICEALRAAGVEVWFDRNELVGGDAWDAKIRGQIASCALFVPVISAATQARLEGYFRLEWKLAAQRTHTMAEEKAFLLPVVIDDTRDAEAKVPAEFKAVQWTRLRQGYGGQAPDEASVVAFCARVRDLLGSGESPSPRGRGAALDPGNETRTRSATNRERRSAPSWLIPAVAGVAATIALALWQPWKATPTAAMTKSENHSPASNAPALNDKSIAVLPFANLSAEKENEFFADGMHAEVLAHLQNIRELRVVSHQSVIGYRGTTKKSPVIGGELGVAYLLGGSVRRAGNVVRVSVQLIDARGDTQIWSLPPRDRTLDNIFAIQSEIANATARALQAALSPGERSQLDLKPTENTEAYDLFLRARELRFRSGFTRNTVGQVTAWLQRAVALDPKFTRAWTELSGVLLETRFLGFDLRPERLVEAKAALDEAIKLAPQATETQLAVARYSHQGLRDYDRALAQCAAVAALHPTNPHVIRLPALIQRRQGRWPEALANLRTAVALDRGDASLLRNLVQTLRAVRRWDEALPAQRRLLELFNGASREAYALGELSFLANGSTKEMEDFIRELERKPGASSQVIAEKKRWAWLRGDFAEAIRLDERQAYFDEENVTRSRQAAHAALTLLATGDTTAARARLAGFPIELRSELRERPDDLRLMASLAVMEIVLGNGAEAVRLQEAALAELEKSDQWNAAIFRAQLAGVLAWAGQKERALDVLRRSLLEADGARVHEVRHSALFTPLRGDPRFEALLNDPKNNAPLF